MLSPTLMQRSVTDSQNGAMLTCLFITAMTI
ncbi:MAG: hypothetical protein K2L34_15370 [Muribaculaceae bacterium]|nr:hypothetical protein [Muribaculaceae bacterium]